VLTVYQFSLGLFDILNNAIIVDTETVNNGINNLQKLLKIISNAAN